ncbi:site-specific integrase [Natronobacterium gregoryi]|uniref:Integrase n=2 Tax=Natronobacterium gregoryi TaxID=44930 RepID=L0AJP0_NATGS|nr:tyrosine-type recombinase/integrase [Natronobacterium gregoryi]AFZ73649.1 site-specific recombinase XerD [Natronobacterium gregoryi SP2]ELY67843.1 integrase family protein [Natronobacterium gregoryi SP2]PLK19628.1 integrase [Natronobacterium gregoryi SP2]SFJ00245.1 Site-specific recombinase XerD [Natronobacterium gregoryi]
MSNDGTTIRWSQMSLEELQSFWSDEIEPALERSGIGREERPAYQQVADAGYSGIAYALREHHDTTLTEFLATVGYEEPGSSTSYQWGIEDETTIDELESYLETLERRRQLATSTVQTKQSRLATYVRIYREVHGQADLVDRVDDATSESDEIRRALVVFDELNYKLGTDASKLRYLSDVSQFYEHLGRRAKAAFNPVEHIDEEYNWSREEPDNAALTGRQVSRLYDASETEAEQLVVLALCAWGLRRNEVAALHTSQLVLEGEDPHIAFGDERKNGPGTVALIYGTPNLTARVDRLEGDLDWAGYLFPSSRSASGHITGETVQARFQRLAEDAGVRVQGELPTSKMGRRFWYTTYNQAMKDLRENLDVIAAEQGSSDSSVVLKNYLSETERRQYRRQFMRERLEDVFEE